jgi:capsular polysaccharide export protein
MKPGLRREFLFLQGLAGPFFSRLGRALSDAGHGVHRINFNGGDWAYWRQAGALNYRGGGRGWPRYLLGVLGGRGITDLVLFGDCRPLHAEAIGIARSRGIQVHVFEEGYIRPDFVTLEVGGVNGHSGLSRDPDHYLRAARRLPPMPAFPGVPSSFARRAREDLVYNIASVALAPLFPGYRTHRPWHILHEYAGWGLRLMRGRAERKRSAATLDRLKADGRSYFVFPLQLNEDYQIRVHSRFPGMAAAIERVMASFARFSPADTLLVVKGHPLDNGLIDWEQCTGEIARQLGIEDRVLFLETADIDLLVQPARGLVTVNSTTGTLSLRHGVPTVVLGDAVYDIPRVTHQGGLDRFWVEPARPDLAVFDAFRRVLVDRCLVHGGYFSEEGMEMLVQGSFDRLQAVEAPAAVIRLAPARPAAASRYATRS